MLLGSQSVLIDAGIGEKRIREIDRRMRIDTLIISHSHPDHILAWHVLKDRQLFLPAQTPASVEDLRRLGQRFVEGRQGAQYWTWVVQSRLGIHPLRRPDHRFDDAFDRYLSAFDRQKAVVFDLFRKGMDLDEMVRRSPFYLNRMFDQTLQRIFETQMIRKNLALLAEERRIIEENGHYRAT